MRKFIVAAVLGLAILAMCGEISEAKAQLPWAYVRSPWGYAHGYRFGPMMNFQTVHYPAYAYQVNPLWYSQMYASPAYARFYRTPYNMGGVIASRAVESYYFSPYFGYGMYYTTPGVAGWSYSPITGYRQYYIPPLGYSTSSFYSGYVPSGYLLP